MAGQAQKRKDKNRIVLKKGESQRPNGTYDYRWTDLYGKRHVIYAKTLDELRMKEKEVERDISDGIKTELRNTTLNEIFDLWSEVKRGLKDNTFQNYKYMYDNFVRPGFGRLRIAQIKTTDVMRFYNTMVDERGLKASTLDSIHSVLHQLFDLAVKDNYIRTNPSDEVMKNLKQVHGFHAEKRKALTVEEQKLLLDYLRRTPMYRHWYPAVAVMLGTGIRVGEATGLRWCDIDLDEGTVDINHTLVYYNHGPKNGCYFNIHSPKTDAGNRVIPMLDFVKEAFLEERAYQEEVGIKCNVSIDGFTDFIFVNRFGETQHQGTLNKALRRIIRDCNYEQLNRDENAKVLLPPFSCHILRHTFATRMIEAGVNIKVVQYIMGHAEISTTLDIYADVTKDFANNEFDGFDAFKTAQFKIAKDNEFKIFGA